MFYTAWGSIEQTEIVEHFVTTGSTFSNTNLSYIPISNLSNNFNTNINSNNITLKCPNLKNNNYNYVIDHYRSNPKNRQIQSYNFSNNLINYNYIISCYQNNTSLNQWILLFNFIKNYLDEILRLYQNNIIVILSNLTNELINKLNTNIQNKKELINYAYMSYNIIYGIIDINNDGTTSNYKNLFIQFYMYNQIPILIEKIKKI